jgi:hypothetical protein
MIPLVELARRCQRTPRNGVPEIVSVLIGRRLAHRLDDNRYAPYRRRTQSQSRQKPRPIV